MQVESVATVDMSGSKVDVSWNWLGDEMNRQAKVLREEHGEVVVPKLPGEQWEFVPGYEDRYLVSNMGRVRRIKKVVQMCEGVDVTVMGDLLNPFSDSKGHLQVKFYTDGQGKQLLVHRLVAAAFLGNIPKGYHIHHINGVKTDNRLATWRCCTPANT